MGKKYGAASVMMKAEKELPGVFVLICLLLILSCDQQIVQNLLEAQDIPNATQQNLLSASLAMGGAHHHVNLASQDLIKHPVARLGRPCLDLSSHKDQRKRQAS